MEAPSPSYLEQVERMTGNRQNRKLALLYGANPLISPLQVRDASAVNTSRPGTPRGQITRTKSDHTESIDIPPYLDNYLPTDLPLNPTAPPRCEENT